MYTQNICFERKYIKKNQNFSNKILFFLLLEKHLCTCILHRHVLVVLCKKAKPLISCFLIVDDQ